jgi:phenylpropionate dioxygenase-like ring-hydroxylating dioxygenase large terminal subunit
MWPLGLTRWTNTRWLARSVSCRSWCFVDRTGLPVVENTIECGYHGFQYDCAGSCVRIPGQVRIPSKVKVHGYPLVEKDGWVWIWTGDVALADESRVPDTHWMNDPEWPKSSTASSTSSNLDLVRSP